MPANLGTRIKRARERKRMTQEDLASQLGVHRRTVDNWENGRSAPKNRLGALEEVLGIRLSSEPPTELDEPEENLPPPASKEDRGKAARERVLAEIKRDPELAVMILDVIARIRGSGEPERASPQNVDIDIDETA
ncbi:helix-turn-helix domain-containing protein [Actinomadura litoris]|uniref:helix-turn-helix domain-containing protein n=1 Tax=Actinomadura litoris TaxID=2678616 RepID=UPI001FA729D9|nr:helix-turn-helix transcriptional regulator [Actinomadura litoris]